MEMSRDDLQQWAQSHDTDEAVAQAIMQMANDDAAMEKLWSEPTSNEVVAVVALAGTFADEDADNLQWGCTIIPMSLVERLSN